MSQTSRVGRVDVAKREGFSVICAGEPMWKRSSVGAAPTSGLLDLVLALARGPGRVGFATVLEDDSVNRRWLAEAAAAGVDLRAVRLVAPVAELVVVEASGEHSRAAADIGIVAGAGVGRVGRTELELEIPPTWSAQVLLLSGLSAATSQLASFCRAARSARRAGTCVVLDAIGGLRHWVGGDSRLITMVLREVDVVRASYFDLAVIGTDAASVRLAMRPDATLVLGDERGTVASGSFGVVRGPGTMRRASDCTAAICAELARPGQGGESVSGRWDRILRLGRGQP